MAKAKDEDCGCNGETEQRKLNEAKRRLDRMASLTQRPARPWPGDFSPDDERDGGHSER